MKAEAATMLASPITASIRDHGVNAEQRLLADVVIFLKYRVGTGKAVHDAGVPQLGVGQRGPLAIAARGCVLETGCITLTGTGLELISNEQIRAACLGM